MVLAYSQAPMRPRALPKTTIYILYLQRLLLSGSIFNFLYDMLVLCLKHNIENRIYKYIVEKKLSLHYMT